MEKNSHIRSAYFSPLDLARIPEAGLTANLVGSALARWRSLRVEGILRHE